MQHSHGILFIIAMAFCTSLLSAPRESCRKKIRDIALDEMTELGHSARHLFELTQVQQELDWTWSSTEQRNTKLFITITPAHTDARIIEFVSENNVQCPGPYVEADAWFEIRTDDGGFQERFLHQLYGSYNSYPPIIEPEHGTPWDEFELHSARFDLIIDSSSVAGNFQDYFPIAQNHSQQFEIRGIFHDTFRYLSLFLEDKPCLDNSCDGEWLIAGYVHPQYIWWPKQLVLAL